MAKQTKQASVFFFCLYLPSTLVTERKLEYRKKVDACEWDKNYCVIFGREINTNKLFTLPPPALPVTYSSGRNMRPIDAFSRGRTQGSQKVTDLGCKGGGPAPSTTCSQNVLDSGVITRRGVVVQHNIAQYRTSYACLDGWWRLTVSHCSRLFRFGFTTDTSFTLQTGCSR
jgi:hypothetical protein